MKASFTLLSNLAKKGSTYIVDTSAGKILMVSGKAAKFAGKVIIYPIDNPATTFAFRAGQRTFDKAFTLGSPKILAQSAVSSTLIKADGEMENLLIRLEEARVKKPEEVVRLEQELVSKIESQRRDLLSEALKKDKVDFNEIVKDLYPELQYGDLAKSLPPEKIVAVEKEVYLQIENMRDGPAKTALTRRYQKHVVQGEARARVVPDNSPSYKKIIDNSKLEKDQRLNEALKLIKRDNLSVQEKEKLAKVLDESHLIGEENGVFEYSWRELRKKHDLLVKGGFTKDEADLLIRHGLAGRPPVREIIQHGNTLFSGFAEDLLDKRYPEKREELEALLKNADPQKKPGIINAFLAELFYETPSSNKITDNLDSLYFVDYTHSNPALNQILIDGTKVEAVKIYERYNKQAFDNFKDTRIFLQTQKPEINKETLLEIHKRMLKGGIADFGSSSDLGKIRSLDLAGNVSANNAITKKVVDEINANPYLIWEPNGTTGPKGEYSYGRILYPNAQDVKPEVLERIRLKHADLVGEIEEYQSLPRILKTQQAALDQMDKASPIYVTEKRKLETLTKRYEDLVSVHKKVNERLINALVDERLEWFNKQRAAIGNINSPEKLDEYVNLLADFQRDLVAIHPLTDGVGRSTREFALSYPLMKEGFPPPRILEPDTDIYSTKEEWRRMVKHGILGSDFLVDDMIERLKVGLPIENSVDLITPYTRPPVKIDLKGQKSAEIFHGMEYIDPRLYREIIKREINANPSLKSDLTKDPTKTWDIIHKKVEEVFDRNNVYYKHPKNGVERLEIGFIDEDFKHLYGKSTFENKEVFDFKMKTWYSDDITWRGLASKHQEKSETEILSMFKQLSAHNASNAVVNKIKGSTDPEVIRKAVMEDFEKYNNDIFGDGLVKMAKDHSETGPMYGMSYGYSTSKSRTVGKAFAQGAMVVGEYGSHNTPELQALLKSRVLVGARKAQKDVDLGRLKQMREEFSYKYGRQQEVMGIGASDPDSITIIQTLDARGDVMMTYLRNKNDPSEIFVVKGEIEPDTIPTPDKIVKTISLKK